MKDGAPVGRRDARRVLIVSPYFPPFNTADMHRVRLSLPHLAECGWQAAVLTVEPTHLEGIREPLLLESLPPGVPVEQARAIPVGLARKLRFSGVAFRAAPFLYAAGARALRRHGADLVYFSTTAFPVMAFGRLWKERYGVPFVLDMQDPWVSDYRPAALRGWNPKRHLAGGLHRVLEPWTMRAVDGLIAVSTAYLTTLQARYPWLAAKPQATLPFGAANEDFETVRRRPQANQFFQLGDGLLHGVYVGRGGTDMAPALSIVLRAFHLGLQQRPDLFSRIRLHFLGTDYATDDRAKRTVAPIAEAMGLGAYVQEETGRIPYFQALQLLLDADFLLVPGSDNPQYTASKIYPYILSRKPLLAVFHEQSSVCDVLRRTGAGTVVPFTIARDGDTLVPAVLAAWLNLLERLPFTPPLDWQAFSPYTAREMTRQQCHVFDQVLAAGRQAA